MDGRVLDRDLYGGRGHDGPDGPGHSGSKMRFRALRSAAGGDGPDRLLLALFGLEGYLDGDPVGAAAPDDLVM